MKHLKLIGYTISKDSNKDGEPLNNKEINFLKGYNIM